MRHFEMDHPFLFAVIQWFATLRSLTVTVDALASSSPVIENRHLNLCCGTPTRMLTLTTDPETGRVIPTAGLAVEILTLLSKQHKFTYSCAHQIFLLENTSTTIGAGRYMNNGECDLRPTADVVRYSRFQMVDFIQPFWTEPAALVIPEPFSTTNLSAVWRPFQDYVWLFIVIFIVLVVASLVVLDLYFGGDGTNRKRKRIDLHGLFATSILLGQSGSFSCRSLSMRLVGGAWCLTAFVLVSAYSSVLISFITAPDFHSLLYSVDELAKRDDIGLVVLKDYATDVILKNHGNDPLLLKLYKKLEKNPNSRCTNITNCFAQVKQGRNVFIQSVGPVLKALANTKSADQCGTALARDTFGSFTLAWGIPKRSPYFEFFNHGVLQMLQFGIVDYQIKGLQLEQRHKCNYNLNGGIKPQTAREKRLEALDLLNLMGPFIILLLGGALSAIVFFAEKIAHSRTHRN